MKKTLITIAAVLAFQTTFAQVPDSIAENITIIKKYVFQDYKLMYKKAGDALHFPYITPGSRSYSAVLWDWDSWLSNVALRQILQDTGTAADKAEALPYEQGCILNFLDYTEYRGIMPIAINQNADPAKLKASLHDFNTNMHKPVIAQHAAFLTRLNNGDAGWLQDKFSIMQTFINNYKSHHRNRETGLYYWQNDYAIGVDNDPSTFFRPDKSSASIYLNCLMYKELLAMVYLSDRLKLKNLKAEYEQDAAELKAAVQKNCWDEKDGYYYSVDLNLRAVSETTTLHSGMPRDWDGLIQRFGVWSGFMTMWAGIATPEQAKRMVAENYLDTRTFNAKYGIRTLSRLEKMYSVRASNNPSNWLGPIWGISNYMTYRGLLKYGYKKEATELAYKTITLFGKDFKANGALHEYYEPDTGEPIMNKGFQNWNYLVLNMIDQLTGQKTIEEF